jgi:hypothetical protein
MSWILRFVVRMSAVLILMIVVESASFVLYRQFGWNRLLWVPLNFGLVAFAAFDTVKRLPLVWGGVVGAVLSGIVNLLEWPTGALVADGRFEFPPEADPLLVATGLLIAVIVGAIVGVVAGIAARRRRRQRARRSALGKLAYTAYDDPLTTDDDLPDPLPGAMAERAHRR